jgi:photosystem II stability/assembly factor-like uncharacterized protein
VKVLRISVLILSLVAFVSLEAGAQDSAALVRHVSGNTPVLGVGTELSAERPVVSPTLEAQARVRPSGNTWTLLATLPFAVIHDVSFATPKIGYAAAEAGEVWKTTDGGKTWTEVLNLSYPYYFYGVEALSAKDVVVSGFYDSSSFYGLIRWSHDGGKTWTNDIDLGSSAWVQRVRFEKKVDGLILDLIGGSENTAQYTTDGGAGASDWTTVVDNPDGGWFGLEFSFLKNLHARASGINFCTSLDGGAQWSCGPSVDSVFDGETFFLNDKIGWVGGGEISPNVEGWVHVTTNGGKTWSGRTLDDPWPIREILFLNAKTGWAAGGNIYSGVGGIYFSSDGGNTWSLDVNTGAEMDACASKPVKPGYQVWCIGYDSSFTAYVYTTQVN